MTHYLNLPAAATGRRRDAIRAPAVARDDALIEAVRSASIETVEVLLARGVDVIFAIPDTGYPALMLAASRDTTEIAELLLHRGADRQRGCLFEARAVIL